MTDASMDPRYCQRFHRAIELLGRRWNGAIIVALGAGAMRFTDLRNTIPGISDRLLGQRLRELESERIVHRVVSPDGSSAAYELTDKGTALDPVIASVSDWADAHAP